MSETTIEADVTIDARGATCPGPLMDLIGRIRSVDEGTVIELQTSDSSSSHDIPEWTDKTGHELLDIVEHEDFWTIYVQKV